MPFEYKRLGQFIYCVATYLQESILRILKSPSVWEMSDSRETSQDPLDSSPKKVKPVFSGPLLRFTCNPRWHQRLQVRSKGSKSGQLLPRSEQHGGTGIQECTTRGGLTNPSVQNPTMSPSLIYAKDSLLSSKLNFKREKWCTIWMRRPWKMDRERSITSAAKKLLAKRKNIGSRPNHRKLIPAAHSWAAMIILSMRKTLSLWLSVKSRGCCAWRG